MMDSLELGETTLGLLIMVVTFVGATVKEVFGAYSMLMAGFAGASVATFFTLLPFFLGGPEVESIRGDLKFSSTLSALIATESGIIVNLSVFFALVTLYQNQQIDCISIAITLVTFIALFSFKIDIMSVIAVSSMIGFQYFKVF